MSYAFSNNYLKTREAVNHAITKCILRYVVLSRIERRAVAIYIVLLCVYGDYIEHIYDKQHMKADSEVQTYQVCKYETGIF